MPTVHVQNTVRDFEAWKSNFDKYEQFRNEQGVQSYRISRGITQPTDVIVDLDFADEESAESFLPKLAKIMASPQAQEHVIEHRPPGLYTVVTDHEAPSLRA